MTNKDYILGKFRAFGLTDAQLEEIGLKISLEDEYSVENETIVGRAMCDLVAEMVLFPRQASVSEAGFSVSWDFANLGKYYMYLCRRYGVKPDAGVTDLLGISMIKDCTSRW